MSTTPSTLRISAVIPAYNAAGTIARAIESVFAQTTPVDEIIVVDDGSTDETAAVVRRVAPRATLVQQSNGGPAAARNTGARKADGDWLAFLDSDDAWRPHKIAVQRPLLADDRCAVVHGFVVDEPRKERIARQVTLDSLWDHNVVGTSTVLLRRTAWEAVGGFDEDRAILGVEDYNLWLRLAHAGWEFACCEQEIVDYTPAAGNLCSQIARMHQSEMTNAAKVAGLVGMPPEKLRSKQAELNAEFGLAMFCARDFPAARRCLGAALAARPSWRVLSRWLATFAPPAMFGAARRSTSHATALT